MDFEKIRNIIAETLSCDVGEVTLEASLTDDLGADSLAAVELMMAIEEETGVSIGDDAMPGLKTVNDIMEYLNANKG